MSISDGSTKRAAGYVGVAVLSYSIVPLLVDMTAADINPLFFRSAMLLGESALLFVFLKRSYPRFFNKQEGAWHVRYFLLYWDTQQDIARPVRPNSLGTWLRTPMVWAVIGSFGISAFVWAITNVDATVAVALFNFWPLVSIGLLVRLDRKLKSGEQRLHTISPEQMILLGFAFVGVVFVIYSQTGSLNFTFDYFYMGLLLTGAFLAGCLSVTNTSMGRLAYAVLYPSAANVTLSTSDQREQQGKLLWFTMLGLFWSRLLAVPFQVVIGVGASRTDLFSAYRDIDVADLGLAVAVLLIGVPTMTGALFLRWALFITPDLGIKGLNYFTPVLSIVLLVLFRGVDVPRTDMLLIGFSIIVAANVLVSADPDQEFNVAEARSITFGLKSLVVGLWLSGTFMYFREDILNDRLQWPGGDYWTVMALSATVFALIFGFRMGRLNLRVNNEGELMLALYQKSEMLVEEGIVSKGVLPVLRRYRLRKENLAEWYASVKAFLHPHALGGHSKEVMRDVYNARSLLDKFAHSRQQGRDFTELVALLLFASSTGVIGLTARPPDLTPWTGFLTEMFTVLLVSTISFLAFYLFDMRRTRRLPVIDEIEGKGSVYFRTTIELRWPRIWALTLTFGMCIVFAYLLYSRWLPA